MARIATLQRPQVHGDAAIIVTFKLRHFRPEHLEPWGVAAQHPQSFMSEVFRREQSVVLTKLEQRAADRGRSVSQFLNILNATVPDFASLVSDVISRE